MTSRFIAGDLGGIARQARRFIVGDSGGVARVLKRAFVGDAGGVARQIFQYGDALTFTAGQVDNDPGNPGTNVSTGYANGSIGSITSGSATLTGGYVMEAFLEDTGNAPYIAISGFVSDPGEGWLTAVSVNGSYCTILTPHSWDGVGDARWGIDTSLSNGGSYALVISHGS